MAVWVFPFPYIFVSPTTLPTHHSLSSEPRSTRLSPLSVTFASDSPWELWHLVELVLKCWTTSSSLAGEFKWYLTSGYPSTSCSCFSRQPDRTCWASNSVRFSRMLCASSGSSTTCSATCSGSCGGFSFFFDLEQREGDVIRGNELERDSFYVRSFPRRTTLCRRPSRSSCWIPANPEYETSWTCL